MQLYILNVETSSKSGKNLVHSLESSNSLLCNISMSHI